MKMERTGAQNRNTTRRDTTARRAGERYRFLAFLFILFTVATMAYMLSDSVRAEAASSPQEPSYKYYTSIQIQKGDTLSQIASEYRTAECGSLEEYMDEICAINHISKDMIHAGQYITIPYYSAAYLE